MLMVDTAFGILPTIYARLPFNVQKNFAAITQMTGVPNAMLVHPSVAARSVKKIVDIGSAPADFFGICYG